MSKAEDVKYFFEHEINKILKWNDLVRELNLTSCIAQEVKTNPMQNNSSLKVRFTDGSNVYIDDPLGRQNAFKVLLPNQEGTVN